MGHFKFNLVVWFSLILIAFIVASIDVMSSKVVALTPEKEPVITKIVFNDLWYKISILMFLMPAMFSYYIHKNKRKSIFIIIAGLILIFFGVEDIFYFVIKGVVVPDELYTLSELNPSLFTRIGFVNLMPGELWWLNNNPCISLFGRPVTPSVLFKSAAFALVVSFILVMI